MPSVDLPSSQWCLVLARGDSGDSKADWKLLMELRLTKDKLDEMRIHGQDGEELMKRGKKHEIMQTKGAIIVSC